MDPRSVILNVRPGSMIPPGNPSDFRHVKVDSQSGADPYYVSVSTEDGGILGCTCPASSHNPTKVCKHGQAVIAQRTLQMDSEDFDGDDSKKSTKDDGPMVRRGVVIDDDDGDDDDDDDIAW